MTELLHEFSCSTDQIIIKRKRTKRTRPSSSTSSSGVFHNSISVSSPTASSTGLSTTTEEDEEDLAANCLILLARGGRVEDKSARKFTEMPTSGYVYECKTCNRAFSSFQALGGHRASHKKPKLIADNSFKDVTVTPNKRIRQQENTNKIHECGICGSEFGSGQALGGHMRRHRSAAIVTSNNKLHISSNIDHAQTLSSSDNAGNVLVLDLNMPAETEEDHRSDDYSSDGQPDRRHYNIYG